MRKNIENYHQKYSKCSGFGFHLEANCLGVSYFWRSFWRPGSWNLADAKMDSKGSEKGAKMEQEDAKRDQTGAQQGAKMMQHFLALCPTPLRHYIITPLHHYAITPRRHYAITPLRHYAMYLQLSCANSNSSHFELHVDLMNGVFVA